MRFDAKISCSNLSHYSIYSLLSVGRDAELYGGKNVFLTDPEDEEFTARGFYERISFDNIKFVYYNVIILNDYNEIYDAIVWWDLLSRIERSNLKNIYADAISQTSDALPEIAIRFIYRQLLIDQFTKGVIQLPSHKKYLDWWKLIPRKNKEKILYENLKPKHIFSYTLEDVKHLYNLPLNELDNETITVLSWWFELDDDKKIYLIHKFINPHFHITAPDIDEIHKLHTRFIEQ